ncbi:MAG: gamma carbonic anhydrase family protein [Acidobacteria bacterium]|nr:gamma carbonic anhydrase family protein [Acidobacteriota bacterium]
MRSGEGIGPSFGERVFIAPGAIVIGDVTLGDDVSIWYNAVVRGDIHRVEIGARSNLQDGVIVHVERGQWPVLVGEDVSVGHGAILHGCTIHRGCMIGIGAVLLNGAEIGEGSIVAAGALVREGVHVPPGSLVAGVPGVVKRAVTPGERDRIRLTAVHYLEYKSRALAGEPDRQTVRGVEDTDS